MPHWYAGSGKTAVSRLNFVVLSLMLLVDLVPRQLLRKILLRLLASWL